MRTHLDTVMGAFSPSEQESSARLFRHLVTRSGAKVALRVDDLADLAGLPKEQVEPLLARLAGGDVRILRPVGDDGYEIFHDVLATAVNEWRGRVEERIRRERERRRRMRYLAAVASALVVAAALAVLTIVGCEARNDAEASEPRLRSRLLSPESRGERRRGATRFAHSRELAASALAELEIDPGRSVELALEAAELEPTQEAETALRRALPAQRRLLEVLAGHTGSVVSAAFSPDGTRVVTASDDGTARIWDAASGEELTLLRGHSGWVVSAAFSPDGTRVVTASYDGTARIWDAASGKELARLRGHTGAVTCGRLQPRRHPRRHRQLRRHRPHLGRRQRRRARAPRGHSDAVDSRRLQPRRHPRRHRHRRRHRPHLGRRQRQGDRGPARPRRRGATRPPSAPTAPRVVTRHDDGTARIWDAASGKEIALLRGQTNAVAAPPSAPTARASSRRQRDGTARIWDAASGKEIALLHGHDRLGAVAAFSPDGARVVTRQLRRHRPHLGRRQRQGDRRCSAATPAWCDSAAFSPDGARVVTASFDGTARIWDAASGEELARLDGHADRVNSAAFSPDGAARRHGVSFDGTARIWDAASGEELARLRRPHRPGQYGRLQPRRHRVVTASSDSTARIWDAASGKEIALLRGP